MSEQFADGEMVSIQPVCGRDGSIGTLQVEQLVAPARKATHSSASVPNFKRMSCLFPSLLLTGKYRNSSWTFMKWDPYGFKDLAGKLNHNEVKRMMRESVQREIRTFICFILMCFFVYLLRDPILCYLEILFLPVPSGKPLTPDHTFFLDCFLLCWELLVL